MLSIFKKFFKNKEDKTNITSNSVYQIFANEVHEKAIEVLNILIKEKKSLDDVTNAILNYNKFEEFKYLFNDYREHFQDSEILCKSAYFSLDILKSILAYKEEKFEEFDINEIKRYIKNAAVFNGQEKIEYIINYYNIKYKKVTNYAFFELYLGFFHNDYFSDFLKNNHYLVKLFSEIDSNILSFEQKMVFDSINNRKGQYYVPEISNVLNVFKNIKHF